MTKGWRFGAGPFLQIEPAWAGLRRPYVPVMFRRMSRRNLKPLNQNEIVIIELALAILEQARDRANKMRVDTIEVRLALRCLRPYLPEQWPLVQFWDGARGDHEIGRSQSCGASYNGIMVQLQKVGLVP